MAALEDLEARVSALEASQADYRAVLSAVNAFGANQRDHAFRLDGLTAQLDDITTQVSEHRQETRAFQRSVGDQLAEIKDLIIGR